MLLILALAIGADPALGEARIASVEAEVADLARLQGTWRLVALEADGRGREPGSGQSILTIKGNDYVERFLQNKQVARGKLTLRATTAPRWMDFHHPDGGRPALGIYRVDGETLTVCWSADGVRPKSLDAPKGSERLIVVYKRLTRE